MPRSAFIAAFALVLACDRAQPAPTPPAISEPPPSEPAPVAAEPSTRHFVGTLALPTEPPKSLDWLIRSEPGEPGEVALWIPEQNVDGLAASRVEQGPDGELVAHWDVLKVNWTIAADGQSCSFSQGGVTVDCDIEEIDEQEFAEYTERDRPQTPKPPFPYRSEDLSIPNPDAEGVTLAATITLPEGEGPFPAVVLVSGSGAQDRDESLFGHKPFWVIADALTRRGIAVVRYDDRGWAKSTGNPEGTSKDFASDTLAVLRFVAARPDIDAHEVGIIGHSEGGMIAPLVASEHPDEVGFIIMLAGPGVVGHKLLALQTELSLRFEQTDEAQRKADAALYAKIYAIAASKKDSDAAKDEIVKLWKAKKGDDPKIDRVLALLSNEWMRYFLAYDPAPALAKVHCPVLALNGTTDIQVDDEQNLPGIAAALKKAKNRDVTIVARPGLNHLFQHSETGNPEDYEKLTETFDPETITLIGDWILERFK